MYFLLGVTISQTSLKGPDSLRFFWSKPQFRRERQGVGDPSGHPLGSSMFFSTVYVITVFVYFL